MSNQPDLLEDGPIFSVGILHNPIEPASRDELLTELMDRLGGTC